VVENLTERGPRLRHGFRSRLAESDAVSLARSVKNETLLVPIGDEVVTGHGVPAETAIDIQSGILSVLAQINTSGIGLRQTADPVRWMANAVLADCGKVRVSLSRQPHLPRSASAPAAAARTRATLVLPRNV
jgi:hypothetical protein